MELIFRWLPVIGPLGIVNIGYRTIIDPSLCFSAFLSPIMLGGTFMLNSNERMDYINRYLSAYENKIKMANQQSVTVSFGNVVKAGQALYHLLRLLQSDNQGTYCTLVVQLIGIGQYKEWCILGTIWGLLFSKMDNKSCFVDFCLAINRHLPGYTAEKCNKISS